MQICSNLSSVVCQKHLLQQKKKFKIKKNVSSTNIIKGHTFVIADIPEAASPYPILDITLPIFKVLLLFLQKTSSIASSSDLSASATAIKVFHNVTVLIFIKFRFNEIYINTILNI